MFCSLRVIHKSQKTWILGGGFIPIFVGTFVPRYTLVFSCKKSDGHISCKEVVPPPTAKSHGQNTCWKIIFRFPNFKRELPGKGSSVNGVPMGHQPSLDHLKHASLVAWILSDLPKERPPKKDREAWGFETCCLQLRSPNWRPGPYRLVATKADAWRSWPKRNVLLWGLCEWQPKGMVNNTVIHSTSPPNTIKQCGNGP